MNICSLTNLLSWFTSLPKIEGDWHEYESKQRKKAGTKLKQQHSQAHLPPPHSQHNPQHPLQEQHQQLSMVKEDQMEDDRVPQAIRPTLSKKHSLSGTIKPSSAPSSAPTIDPMGTGDADIVMAGADSAPKREPPVLPETFVPPPSVSPSYLPHPALPTHSAPRPTVEMATSGGIHSAASQSQLPPPPPPPPLPPPPPPLPPVMPTYAHAMIDPLTKQPESAPRVSDSSMLIDPAIDPSQGRYQDTGAIPGFDQSRQVATQGVTPPLHGESHRHAIGGDQEHDSQSIPIPTGPAGYSGSKGYHEGHEHEGHYGYYGRNRHYNDYGRDRERDRERDRDRYRDYGRRREDYRGRDWSREREHDRGPVGGGGGGGGRDRERGGREYDWYRDHAGRERDRGGRDRNFDDDEYYYRNRRDRERDYERDFDRRDRRERDRERDREREGDRRDRDPEKDDEQNQDLDRGRDLDNEHDRDMSLSRERSYNRDRNHGGFKDLDDDFERALDREHERVRGRSRDHGHDFFEDKAMESRSERDDGEYEEEDGRQNDGRKVEDQSGFRSSAKRLKVSTDSSSLSSLSTLTTLSSLT